MKTLKYITLACFALGLTFASCESYEQDQYKDNGSNDQLAHQPLGDKLEVHPLGETIEISFTSAVDWYLGITGDTWVSVKPMDGKAGTTKLTITVKPYLDDGKIGNVEGIEDIKDRTSDLIFRDANLNSIDRCTISQELAYIIFAGDVDNSFDFDYLGTEVQEITIKSNIDWQIALVGSDFNLKKGDNNANSYLIRPEDGTHNLTLTAKDNYYITDVTQWNSSVKREAQLSISPLCRSWETGSLKYNPADDITALNYSITQDYRVMFLSAEVPDENNWPNLTPITAIEKSMSPFGTNHLDDESAAIAEFYCIYDVKNGRPAPDMEVENTYSNDAESFAVDEPSSVITIDGRQIMAQKYNVAVITPNTNLMQDRKMLCSVMDNDNEVQKLTVVQGHFDFSLQYEDSGKLTNVPNTIHYSYVAGDERQFSVETNEASLKWTLHIDNSAFCCDDGLDVGEHSGSSRFTISTSNINYYISQPQTAEVSISSTLDGVGELETIKFNLEQEAFLFKFADSVATSKEMSLAVDAESATVKFNSYGDLDISVSNDYSWLEVEATKSSDTDNEYSIALTIKTPHKDFKNQKNKKNLGIDKRSETVNIVSKVHAEDKDKHGMEESDYTKTIIVEQAAYEFKVKKDKIEAPADGGSFDVGVTCTNTYTYSVGTDSKDWISVTETKNGIKVTVAKNETTEVRDGIVTIKDTEFENSYEITVTQEAGEEPEEPEDDNGGGVIE